jgi:hypothetical protein
MDYAMGQGNQDNGRDWANTQQRGEDNDGRIAQLEAYLTSGPKASRFARAH